MPTVSDPSLQSQSLSLYTQSRRSDLADENRRFESGETLRAFNAPTLAEAKPDASRGIVPGTMLKAFTVGTRVEVLLPTDPSAPIAVWTKREAAGWAQGEEVTAINTFTPLNSKQAAALRTAVAAYRARYMNPTHAYLAHQTWPVPVVGTPVTEQRPVLEFLDSDIFERRYAHYGDRKHEVGLRHFSNWQSQIARWEQVFSELTERTQGLVTAAKGSRPTRLP